MNVTLTEAEEVWLKKDKKRVDLGRILLKGDNIVSLKDPFWLRTKTHPFSPLDTHPNRSMSVTVGPL